MKFTRPDYQGRIIDTSGKIPEDEPCFLLRGQDPIAHEVVARYAELAAQRGCQSELVDAARVSAAEMRGHLIRLGDAQKDHLPDVPVPDTGGPVPESAPSGDDAPGPGDEDAGATIPADADDPGAPTQPVESEPDPEPEIAAAAGEIANGPGPGVVGTAEPASTATATDTGPEPEPAPKVES